MKLIIPLHRFKDWTGWTMLLTICSTTPFLVDAGPPAQKVVEDTAEVEDADPEALRLLAYRDRRLEVLLASSEQALREGRTAQGLGSLQTVLDRRQDSFSIAGPQPRIGSVRRAAAQLLSQSSGTVQRQYEAMYGPAADALLTAARASGDPALFRTIVERFFHTEAGFHASAWLASHWMDRGAHELSSRLWDRLLREPAHQSRLSPVHQLRAAVAQRLACGSTQSEEPPVLAASDAIVSIAGEPVRVRQWATNQLASLEPPPAVDGWNVLLGNARRNASVTGSAPFLKAQWQVQLVGENDYQLKEHLDSWRRDQRKNYWPVAVSNAPIVVAGRVIVRAPSGVVAIDARTGKAVWSFTSAVTLRDALSQSLQRRTASRVHRFDETAGTDYRDLLAGNSTLGSLSSDGRRIYAVELVERVATEAGFAPQSDSFHTRLVALDVAPRQDEAASMLPVWTVGGPARGEEEQPLADHFFLGPPLPVEGHLFAVTEQNGQLSVHALDPETGHPIWSQGLAFVETPIDRDVVRQSLSCSPSFARGVLVCPTQVGVVMGVDATNGQLLWASYYGDREPYGSQTRVPTTRFPRGDAGFPDTPHIHGNRVVHLARHSSELRCLDLATGRLIWTRPRIDIDYVAAVTDQLVLLVESAGASAVDLATGEQRWQRDDLGIPAGTGVTVGTHYLLPLEDGSIASLEIESGQVASAPPQRTEAPLGNLVAYGDLVLSAGIEQVTAYPQAQALLARVEQSLTTDAASPDNRILAAELQLTLGRIPAARRQLAALPDEGLTPFHRDRADQLVRGMLYHDLENPQADERRILHELSALARTPEERTRYLLYATARMLRLGEHQALTSALEELAAVGYAEPLATPENPKHFISAGSWIRRILDRLDRTADETVRADIELAIDLQQQKALESGRVVELRRFLAAFGGRPQAAEVRLRLAELLIDDARLQEAEFVLIDARARDDDSTAAAATALLMEVWEAAGLYEQAASLHEELRTRHAATPLPDGRIGRETAAGLSRDGLTWPAARNRVPPDWAIERVVVRERTLPRLALAARAGEPLELNADETGPALAGIYSHIRQRLNPPTGSPYELLIKGSGRETLLTVVDRQSGVAAGTMPLTTSYNFPAGGPASSAHFLPMATASELRGISLLQFGGEPLWQRTPPELKDRETLATVGPSGPTFCVFKSRHHLFVLDPADGQVLWMRSDLDPSSGTRSEAVGLFGDDQVLVVFDGDRSSYTVYETMTGVVKHRGRLSIDLGQPVRAFGRRLCYLTTPSLERRLRIWDPLENRDVLDEPAGGKVYTDVTPDQELVFLLPDNHLRILHVDTLEARLDLPLDEAALDSLSFLRVFSDEEQYYVCLQKTEMGRRRSSSRQYSSTSNTYLDSESIRDDLYAVDRASGKIRWVRTVPQRTVLHMPEYRLPFLVTMSRTRDPGNGNTQASLVEVLNAATGQTLGHAGNLSLDRIVQRSYDRDAGRLVLHGLKSDIELSFGRSVPRVPTIDGPF